MYPFQGMIDGGDCSFPRVALPLTLGYDMLPFQGKAPAIRNARYKTRIITTVFPEGDAYIQPRISAKRATLGTRQTTRIHSLKGIHNPQPWDLCIPFREKSIVGYFASQGDAAADPGLRYVALSGQDAAALIGGYFPLPKEQIVEKSKNHLTFLRVPLFYNYGTIEVVKSV